MIHHYSEGQVARPAPHCVVGDVSLFIVFLLFLCQLRKVSMICQSKTWNFLLALVEFCDKCTHKPMEFCDRIVDNLWNFVI